MGRQDKKQQMSKVYREFSRQKYNKYKHQFPKMRESQIVSKIIKEWDNLDNVAKENLQKIYEEKKFLTNDDISSSEALMKAEQGKREALKAAQRAIHQTSSENRPSATKFYPAASGAKSDSDFKRSSDQQVDSKVVDSQSPGLVVRAPKTKQIAKTPKTDYIAFFKLSYARISAEHPRWQPNQISAIIKLLWRKRKSQSKTILSQSKKDGKKRTLKVISGRRFFRKTHHYTYIESKSKWARLPFETKKYWDNQSKQITLSMDPKKQTKVTLKSALGNENIISFNYMMKKSLK